MQAFAERAREVRPPAREDPQERRDREDAARGGRDRPDRGQPQRGRDLRGGRLPRHLPRLPALGRRHEGRAAARDSRTQTRLSIGAESTAAIDRLADGDGRPRRHARRRHRDRLRRPAIRGTTRGSRRARSARAATAGCKPLGVFTYPGHGGTVGARESGARDQAEALRCRRRRHCAEHGDRGPRSSARGRRRPPSSASIRSSPRSARASTSSTTTTTCVSATADRRTSALFVASTVVSDQGHAHVDHRRRDEGTRPRRAIPSAATDRCRATTDTSRSSTSTTASCSCPRAAQGPAVGERVAVVPHHVCPVVNSFEELMIIADRSGELATDGPVDAQGQLN